MTTQPGARDIARHESAHAAALLLQGMTPKWARIDYPDEMTFGSVEIDWGDGIDRDKARRVLIATLAGAMTESVFGWDWPIDPDRIAAGARSDAEHAQKLAGYLDLEEADWLYLKWQANQLAGSRAFRRLQVRIMEAFEDQEVLDADQLRHLMEEA